MIGRWLLDLEFSGGLTKGLARHPSETNTKMLLIRICTKKIHTHTCTGLDYFSLLVILWLDKLEQKIKMWNTEEISKRYSEWILLFDLKIRLTVFWTFFSHQIFYWAGIIYIHSWSTVQGNFWTKRFVKGRKKKEYQKWKSICHEILGHWSPPIISPKSRNQLFKIYGQNWKKIFTCTR